MKKIWLFLSVIVLFTSCADDLDLTPANPSAKTQDVTQLDGPIFQLPHVWSKLTVPINNDYPFNFPEGNNSIYQVNGQIYCAVGGIEEVLYKLNQSTYKWELFNDPYHMAVELWVHEYFFSYGPYAYYGLLGGSDEDAKLVHALNPVTGATTPVPNFPGTRVHNFQSFVIGTKGYLVGGETWGQKASNQYWEYDFITKTWTNKGALPGGSRAAGVAVVMGESVYLGLGYTYLNWQGTMIPVNLTNWVKITPSTNTVTNLAAFPGTARSSSRTFVVNGKIYLLGGNSATAGVENEFWEYNPTTNVWTSKGTLPMIADDADNLGTFTIGNTGFVVKGTVAEFWKYSRAVITIPQ